MKPPSEIAAQLRELPASEPRKPLEDEFAVSLHSMRRRVLAKLRSRAGVDADLEDATQELFIKLRRDLRDGQAERRLTDTPMLARRLLLGVLALASCEDAGTRSWVGEHITYTTHVSTGLAPCGGQADFSDRLARVVAEQWQPGVPSSVSATLELRLDGTETLSGRAVRGSAWASKQESVLHELGHLIIFDQDGVSAPILSEGVAELIGPRGVAQAYLPPPDPTTYAYLPQHEFLTPEYHLAAQLLSFLSRRYGLAEVRDAYQRVGPEATEEQLNEVFVSVFGDEFFDALEEFQSAPPCPQLLWQCDERVLPSVPLPFKLDVDPHSCADTDMLGFTTHLSDDWYPEYLGVLRLSEPRMLRYRLENATITRQECQDSCTPMESLPPWTWQFITELLGETEFVSHTRAGDHHVRIRPDDPQRPFSVEILDLGPV